MLTPCVYVAIKQLVRPTDSIGKVQGSEEYQRSMRGPEVPKRTSGHTTLERSPWCGLFISRAPTLVQWTLGRCRPPRTLVDVDIEAVQDLLAELKTAAEGRLGHLSCFASIGVSHISKVEIYKRQVIQEAAANIGLLLVRGEPSHGMVMALQYYEVTDEEDDHPILVLDSTLFGSRFQPRVGGGGHSRSCFAATTTLPTQPLTCVNKLSSFQELLARPAKLEDRYYARLSWHSRKKDSSWKREQLRPR